VFIHPAAEDYRKIYQYNYGATKLAIRRAMSDYPGIEKVLKEKDRGTHPIMGFKVTRLWSPPYIQVALDLDNLDTMEKIISTVPDRERVLLEAGTPLIKKFGVGVVSKIRALRPDAFIIADLKTLDVGRVEIKMAADETADAVAISGLGTIESIEKAIHEAQKQGIYSILDMMNVDNFKEKLNQLKDDLKPNIVLLHRNVDLETSMAEKGEDTSNMTEWGNIKEIKKLIDDGLVAVAGGITPEKVDEAISSGADIIVVGRYIIGSRDVRRSAEDFLAHLPQDPDNMRLALDEDEQV
jgi:bifunctional enzyme Fae/Hps